MMPVSSSIRPQPVSESTDGRTHLALSESRRFLQSYAIEDLGPVMSRGPTRVLLYSLAFVTFLTVCALTLTWAIPDIQRARILHSPFGTSLWIGRAGASDHVLTNDRLSEVKSQIASAVPEGRTSIQGFNQFSLVFSCADAHDGEREVHGRSVQTPDNLLERLLPDKPPVTGMGVIVTADFLADLGFKHVDSVDQIKVRFWGEPQRMPLPVLGVVRSRLPNNHQFLVRAEEYPNLYLQGHQWKSRSVNWGPLPESAPLLDDLSGDTNLSEWYEDIQNGGFEIQEVKSPQGQRYWRIVLGTTRNTEMTDTENNRKPGMTKMEWEKETDSISKVFQFKTSPPIELNDPEPPEIPSWNGFDMAEVRVDDLRLLRSVASATRDAGYPADNTLVEQVDEVQRNGLLLFWSALGLCLGILLNTLSVLTAIQRLRCEQKIPEIGMLKIMGMTPEEFRFVLFKQTGRIWWISTGLGCLLAGIALGAVGAIFFSHEFERRPLWIALIGTIPMVAIVMYFAILLSLFWATQRAREMEPWETVRLG